jgi:predicted metalloendopeptidase
MFYLLIMTLQVSIYCSLGSQFDKDGNLHNWWNPESYHGFEARKECIINQYSAYHVPGTEFKVLVYRLYSLR